MYYEISETTARTAWEMGHMSDYRPGSATAAYRAAVDKAAEAAAKRKAATSAFYHDKIDRTLDTYARRLAAWTNARNRNHAAYPAWFVSGPANYNTRKHNAQMRREDALWQEYREIQEIAESISSIGTGPIDFADPHAREMLIERISQLQAALADAKNVNAYWRKHGTLAGYGSFTAEHAAALDEALHRDPHHRPPMPEYELASLRGKIKRAQERLAEYDKLHQPATDNSAADVAAMPFENATPPCHFETETATGEIVRNVELNRLQILFDDIPAPELREALKSNGFRWSPRSSAWQRQLTANAEYAAKKVLGIA